VTADQAAPEAEAYFDAVLDRWLGESYDSFDPWGSHLAAFFDVAQVLVTMGEYLPSEWQVSNIYPIIDGSDDDYAAADLLMLTQQEGITADELRVFGSWLGEQVERYEAAGLAY